MATASDGETPCSRAVAPTIDRTVCLEGWLRAARVARLCAAEALTPAAGRAVDPAGASSAPSAPGMVRRRPMAMVLLLIPLAERIAAEVVP